jgi:hypothetical protein
MARRVAVPWVGAGHSVRFVRPLFPTLVFLENLMNLKCPACHRDGLTQDGSNPSNYRCSNCGAITSEQMLAGAGKAFKKQTRDDDPTMQAAIREVKGDAPGIARRVVDEMLLLIFRGGNP